MITDPLERRRRRRALVGGATLLVLVAAGAGWVTASRTAPAVPVPLSLVQHEDLGERVLLMAQEVQAPASTPARTPQQPASALVGPAGLSGRAVDDVAAYAQQTDREREALAARGGQVTDVSVVLDGMSATRELGGPLRVCARVHTTHAGGGAPAWEDVIPWVLTVDPGSQRITAVDVEVRDGVPSTC